MLKLGELALITGSVGFLGLGLLLLVPQMFQKEEAPQPRIKNLYVSCWTPSEFTGNMVAYTNNVCKMNLLNNETYSLAEHELIPSASESRRTTDIFEGIGIQDAEEEPWRKPAIIMTVVFEFLMAFVFYAIISIGCQGSSNVCKVVSVTGHVIGIIFFFLASFIPYMSLKEGKATDLDSQSVKPQGGSGQVMCDFAIRRLGNMVRYTMQCGYSFEVSSPMKDAGEGVNPYLILNGMIGGAVIILALGSLVSRLVSKSKNDDYSIANKPL